MADDVHNIGLSWSPTNRSKPNSKERWVQ
jgi:hypothetical protein